MHTPKAHVLSQSFPHTNTQSVNTESLTMADGIFLKFTQS